MSSAAIMTEINRKQAQLEAIQCKLKEETMKCENVEEFQTKVKQEQRSFSEALSERLTHLNTITDILENVKIAKAYHTHTQEMLSGVHFSQAEGKYSAMASSIKTVLNGILDAIDGLELKIISLKNEISTLHINYQHALVQEETERRAQETANRAAQAAAERDRRGER